MANDLIRPSELETERSTPVASEWMVVDNGGTVARAKIADVVKSGRPAASQAEAIAGEDAEKVMTPLTTRQAYEGQIEALFQEGLQSYADEVVDATADLVAQAERAAAMTGGIVVSTLVQLQAETPSGENLGGVVLLDPDPKNNGYYRWDGDDWDGPRPFPDTIAAVTLSGNGIAQTGTPRPGVNPASVLVYFGEVTTPNTGPLKLTIGGVQREVLNAAGNPLSPREWIGGVMFRINPVGKFQLINDAWATQHSIEQANRAEADADRAEAAAVVSSGAMSAVVLAENTFATKTTAEAWSPVAAPDFIRTAGYSSAGDGGGALYKKVDDEPSHAGKLSVTLADGETVAWYELAEKSVSIRAFGAKLDGSDDTNAVQNAFDVGTALGVNVEIPHGNAVVSSLGVTGDLVVLGKGTLKFEPDTATHLILVSGSGTKFEVRDISIDGAYADREASGKYASIRFSANGTATDYASFTARNVTFLNGNWADIQVRTNDAFRSSLERVTIDNCRFLNGREGTTVSDDTRCISIESPCLLSIVNNLLDIVTTPTIYGRAGITVFDGHSTGESDIDGARSVIANNVLHGMGRSQTTSSLAAIEVYNTARSINISNNVVLNSFGRGIQTKADAYNVAISGNVVDTVSALPGQIVDSCIVVNRATKPRARGNVTIVGNACSNSSGAGISISGQDLDGTATMRGVVVANNVLRSIATRGIAALYLDGVVITGNALDGVNGVGIFVNDMPRRSLISNNEVSNVTGSGILVGNNMASGSVVIQGNMVDTVSAIGIAIEAAQNVSIKGNTSRNCDTQDLRVRNVSGIAVIEGNTLASAVSYSSQGLTGQVSFSGNVYANEPATSVRRLNLSSSVVRVTMDWHAVDTQSEASAGNLDTINGGFDGAVVTLRPFNTGRIVTVRHNIGNILLSGGADFAMTNSRNSITMRKVGGSWFEIGRST